MHLIFHAQEVYYAEGRDGDIINLSFQEFPDPEIDYANNHFELPPSVKGVFFSVNYELPSSDIFVSWCDGEEERDDELIEAITLTETSLTMILKSGASFNVSFATDAVTFENIKSLLAK